jgi:hypothetical protein
MSEMRKSPFLELNLRNGLQGLNPTIEQSVMLGGHLPDCTDNPDLLADKMVFPVVITIFLVDSYNFTPVILFKLRQASLLSRILGQFNRNMYKLIVSKKRRSKAPLWFLN